MAVCSASPSPLRSFVEGFAAAPYAVRRASFPKKPIRVTRWLSLGLARGVSAAARGFAGDVYAAFVPVGEQTPEETQRFLDDLWRDAPIRVALATSVGALVVQLSPLLVLRKFTVFTRLDRDERERVMTRLMTADAYVVRLLFYGVKSMALVAVLRAPDTRRELGLDPWDPR